MIVSSCQFTRVATSQNLSKKKLKIQQNFRDFYCIALFQYYLKEIYSPVSVLSHNPT